MSFQVGYGFLSVADPALNFARVLFGFQIAITRDVSDLLLDRPFHFVETSLDVVLMLVFIFLLRHLEAQIAALLGLFEGCQCCKSRSFLMSEQN